MTDTGEEWVGDENEDVRQEKEANGREWTRMRIILTRKRRQMAESEWDGMGHLNYSWVAKQKHQYNRLIYNSGIPNT